MSDADTSNDFAIQKTYGNNPLSIEATYRRNFSWHNYTEITQKGVLEF